jgi:hypothetical protein
MSEKIVEKELSQYDTNADGRYSKDEVRVIVRDVLKAKAESKAWKSAWYHMAFAMMLSCGLFIALIIAGVEATKESHVKSKVVTSLEGEPVQTSALESYVTIPALLALGDSDLSKVKQLAFGRYSSIFQLVVNEHDFRCLDEQV